MHSKHECNYLLATHGAAVAVACTHYGNNVGCEYCSYDCHYCHYDQAAATTTTATTATTATASTPTLRSNTSNTIMAYISGQYAHGMHYAVTTWGNVRPATCNVYRCCHCTPQPTKRMQTPLWHRNCNSHNPVEQYSKSLAGW